MKPEPLIYLVDDDPRILVAIRRALSIAGYQVACYQDAESFLNCHDPSIPGCVVVDLDLPGMDGLDIQHQLASSPAKRQLIFLSGKGDIPTSVRAMKDGALDFLTKPVEFAALLAAIRSGLDRDRETRTLDDDRRAFEERLQKLTPRERQVLVLVVAGLLNKQIAFELGIVEKTVKVHRARMMAKMGCRTVAELARMMAYEQSRNERLH